MKKRDQRSRKSKRSQRRAIVRKSVGGKGRELADALYGPIATDEDVNLNRLKELLDPFPENSQDENSGNA